MNDQQSKMLAETVLVHDELLNQMQLNFIRLFERVIPLLPEDDIDAIALARDFEQIEALVEAATENRKKLREDLGLPPQQ